MPQHLTLVRLLGTPVPKSEAEADFASLLRLYHLSIPENERRPDAEISQLRLSPDSDVRVAKDRHGQVVGFAILFRPLAAPYALLEYTAVDETRRGEGLGSRVIEALNLEMSQQGRSLIAEIEDPEEPGLAPSDRALRQRRAEFYHRLDYQKLAGLRYYLPLKTSLTLPHMILIIHLADPDLILDKGRVCDWLMEIYVAVYGCSACDPRLGLMGQQLVDPLTLAPLLGKALC